jgi:transcriptional regulator with XRE-family HTH domain
MRGLGEPGGGARRPVDGNGRATAAFAENLRAVRLRLGLSQERLASLSRLHRTEISLLERGEREPRLNTIVRLARGLGVAPAELLHGIDER